MALILNNLPYLLDLNTSTPFSTFVHHLYLSASTTPICNSMLGCYLHQTPCHKVPHIPNQLFIIHVRRVVRLITTHLASLAALHKLHCANYTNQICPTIAIKKSPKKEYIRLIKTWQRINPKIFTPYLRTKAKTWSTWTRILRK